MNLRRLTGRAVAAGAVSAMAAGALVGIASPAAQAAVPSVGYTCVTPFSAQPIPVLVGVGGFPTELEAGKAVAAGDLALPTDFTLTRAVLDGMKQSGINQVGISTSNFALGLGATPVGLTGLSVPKAPVPETGDMVLSAAGKNAAFTAPAAGTYDLTMPAAFVASVDTNLIPLTVNCSITDPTTAKVGSVTTTGDTVPEPVLQDSTTAAKGPASIKQGKSAKLKVTVTADAPATGKVTATEKRKTLGTATLSASGTATITVKGLKPGTHKITVAYGGDELTNPSTSGVVKVKVIKKKK